MKFIPKLSLKSFMEIKDTPPEVKARLRELDPTQLPPKEVYLSWEGYSRAPKKEANKAFTRTFTIIGIVVALFLILMQYGLLVVAVISLIFVNYILSKTPPDLTKYEISSHGVSLGGTQYYWPQLKHFFFAQYEATEILCVDTYLGLPGRLFLSIKPEDKEQILNLLSAHLLFLPEEPKTFLDHGYAWFMNKFTLKTEKPEK